MGCKAEPLLRGETEAEGCAAWAGAAPGCGEGGKGLFCSDLRARTVAAPCAHLRGSVVKAKETRWGHRGVQEDGER